MPDTGPLSAKLTEIDVRNEDRIRWARYTEYTVEHGAAEGDVRRLLKAVDKVLALHSPRMDRVLGNSCSAHRHPLPGCGKPTLRPVPECPGCVQDRQREVCPECRDEFGDPGLFGDCRVRSAVLAGLTGEVDGR